MLRLIYFLLIGLAAGWIASRIMKTGFGLIGYLIVGVIGAFVGGLLFGLVGLSTTNIIGELISAVAGAVVFIYILRYLKT